MYTVSETVSKHDVLIMSFFLERDPPFPSLLIPVLQILGLSLRLLQLHLQALASLQGAPLLLRQIPQLALELLRLLQSINEIVG